MNLWLALVLAFPASNGTDRMRAWRALKAGGAAVLRDGVYLLPRTPACQALLAAVEQDVRTAQGVAVLLPVDDPDGVRFVELFDRSQEYSNMRAEIGACYAQLNADNALATTKAVRRLRKAYAQLEAIDYFPGEARAQTDRDLKALEVAVNRSLSADEPGSTDVPVRTLRIEDYRHQVWATRKRPWVDRLASAWLIKRFIDPCAQFLWLEHPADCPADALGFDFDKATFTHVGHRVTFETLADSFALDAPGLKAVALLVHYLDVGGVQPAEAAGIERVLAGLRENILDDDALLSAASAVFDGLLAGFRGDDKSHE